MPVLDLFAPDNWIRATLLATAGKTTLVNGVLVPADAPALVNDRIHPLRDDLEPEGWPYIVYSGTPNFERYAGDAVLMTGEYSIRGVMREDKLRALGIATDIEDYTKQLYVAICAAFDGVNFTDATSGQIHSCEIVAPWIRLYGEKTRKVSEQGATVRIYAS